MKESYLTGFYITITSLGYISILTGGTLLSRLLKFSFSKDIFNKYNESFPQEERLLENNYSANLPTRYMLKNKQPYRELGADFLDRGIALQVQEKPRSCIR